MTRFILVRHGQTVWHSDGIERAEGRAEVDLDEVGRRQARATAARLAPLEIAAVYSSPLKRAFNTALILAARKGLTVQADPGLIDIDYGRWQGLTHQEAQASDAALYDLWLRKPHLVTFPGGESLADVKQRMISTVESLALKHDGQSVLLVSHKVACKVLLCHLLGLDESHFWSLQQGFCAINIFDLGEGLPYIRLINDTCHLEEHG